MDKFKNKYRIQSHRKSNWDYSTDALYFLTINTQNRKCNLGKIINQNIILSDFGKIVETEWHKSFKIRNELILHQFVIMPNHLHAIVEIYTPPGNETPYVNEMPFVNDVSSVETHGRASLPNTTIPPNATISPNEKPLPINPKSLSIKRNPPIRLPKSISSFIAGFKSSVNTKIDDYIDEQKLSIPKYNKNNHFFQPNYHDHIIRNSIEYQNISNYIINNPANWNNDSLK